MMLCKHWCHAAAALQYAVPRPAGARRTDPHLPLSARYRAAVLCCAVMMQCCCAAACAVDTQHSLAGYLGPSLPALRDACRTVRQHRSIVTAPLHRVTPQALTSPMSAPVLKEAVLGRGCQRVALLPPVIMWLQTWWRLRSSTSPAWPSASSRRRRQVGLPCRCDAA